MTRKPGRFEAWRLSASGAEVVSGDMNDPRSLAAAMQGVHGVFSVQMSQGFEYGFTMADEVRQGIAVADAAKTAEIKHLVYTSFAGAERGLGLAVWDGKWEIERHIRAIGLPATVFRPVSFMENFHGLTPALLRAGHLPTALLPHVSQQLISVEDVAVFTSFALENPDFYLGQAFEIAADSLTPAEMAAAMARAFGRPLSYVQISMEEIRRKHSDDFARSYDFFNEKGGYRADIAALKKLHPELMGYDTWLYQHGLALFSAMSGATNVPPPSRSAS
jgi:uncharacterized protein YbjT (DUF2867 family)